METANGKKLSAKDLLLMSETDWCKLREELTDAEQRAVAIKLSAMSVAASRLSDYLGGVHEMVALRNDIRNKRNARVTESRRISRHV